MTGEPESGRSFERTLAYAEYRHGAMVERRNIGLRIVVGVVTFDLILLKLAADAAERASRPDLIAMGIRGIAVGAFLALVGMLIQLELRNRGDRVDYGHADKELQALQWLSEEPPSKPEPEHLRATVLKSWATTWSLVGVFVLTIAICLLAGPLTEQQPASVAAAPGTHTAHVEAQGASVGR